jgi:hypothetical protein
MWVSVASINGRPVDEKRNTIKSVDDVIVSKDGTFTATIQRYGSLSAYAFADGKYQLEFYAGFSRAWQSVEVAKAAGVVLDAEDRSDAGEPRALPSSADLVRESFLGEKVRFLKASRTINLLPGSGQASSYKTRTIRLDIHDISSAKNPVRTIKATDLLVREVSGKVSRLTPNQAVSVVCVGDFKNGFGYIAADLVYSGGSTNRAFTTTYSTTIADICRQQEDALSKREK